MFVYFLRFAFGFFQQIFPCIVLLTLPYEKESFSHGKRRFAGRMSCLGLALSLLFGILMTGLFYHSGKRIVFFGEIREAAVGNACMAFAAILLILLYWNKTKTDFNKKMIVLILAMDYAILEYILVNSLLYLLNIYFSIHNPDIYSPLTLLLFLAVKSLTLPFMGLFMSRIVREYLSGRSAQMMKRSLAMVSVITILYILFLASSAMAYESISGFQTNFIRFHFMGDFLFGLASLAIIYWYIFREADLDMKESEFRHQLEIQQIQYNAIRSDIDNASRIRHDIRHHMRVLERFLEDGRQEDAMNYLQDVTSSCTTTETERFCKDPVLNALLQYYFAEAKDKQIRLELHIDVKDCRVDRADMTVVMGNLLENSIHACEQVTEDRFIRLYMGVVNNVLAMILENSCPAMETAGMPSKITGEFMSGETVRRQPWAGVGLKSVIATVRKYNGSSEFRYADGVFCCRMNMEWETGKQEL